jgi:hypothetical protein
MNSNNSNHSRAASARGFLARFAITPLAAIGILAGTVPAARADDTPCPPTPSGTINGNLTVPAGATCALGPGTVTVTGNVQVGKGASLLVQPHGGQTITIGGNVQADRCQSVLVDVLEGGAMSVGGNVQADRCQSVSVDVLEGGAMSVGGNVHIQNCTALSGYNGAITISGNFACANNSGTCIARLGSVRGNVQVNNNSGGSDPGADVEQNNVGGNVQVNNNSGSTAAFVGANTIGGNLQCAGNTPSVSGGGNMVTGTKQGQCAGL